MCEIYDHTADLGFRVRADLLADAARGLTAVICDDPATIRRLFTESFTVESRGLRVTVGGERYDAARRALAHEVRAITQHELDVREAADRSEAFFIVDL